MCWKILIPMPNDGKVQVAKGKKEKFWEELKEQRTPIDRKPVKAEKEKEFFLEERPARTTRRMVKKRGNVKAKL